MLNLLGKFRFAPVLALLAMPAWGDLLYTTGPIDGTATSYNITSYVTSDSFILSSESTVTDLSNVGIWFGGDVSTFTLNWTISTAPDAGGTVEASQSGASPSSYTLLPDTNSSDLPVYDMSFSVPDLYLGGGTYYLTLADASSFGYWDQNNGFPLATQYNSGGNEVGSGFSVSFGVDGIAGVPEPASLVLLGAGLAALALQKRFRTR